jgi:hypothetical protein
VIVAEPQRIENLTEDNTRDNGVRCPKCHCRDLRTIGGTHRHFATSTRKKRRCRHCLYEFWTLEQIVEG